MLTILTHTGFSNSTMQDLLSKILTNVNEWLRFAEAKNALLIGFNGAGLLLMAKLGDSYHIDVTMLPFSASNILLICGILLSFFSFYPITRIDNFLNRNRPPVKESDNLLFFGHVSKYDKQLYLDELSKYLNSTIHAGPTGKIELDYAEQIITNSQIVSHKLRLFSLSVIVDLVAFFLIVLYLSARVISDIL